MDIQKGTLYLVGTPIGNLDDMTYRAVEVLQKVDVVAAEDTRNSMRLLSHFDIKKPLLSYHEHNRASRGPQLLERLRQGESIALITDAGMPAVSDPGEDLVRLCHESGVPVSPIPGACAAICAVAASGLDTRKFLFWGFLPVPAAERKKSLQQLQQQTYTVILYEAPHKLRGTLAELLAVLGDRKLTICRELTKRYEEIRPTTLSKAVECYETCEPRGEFALVLEGAPEPACTVWDEQSAMELLRSLMEQEGCSSKEAAKRAVELTGMKKNRLYELALRCKQS